MRRSTDNRHYCLASERSVGYRRGSRIARSASDSISPCTVSKTVKLIENAIGPFIQFMLTPLKNPNMPCSAYSDLTVDINVGGPSFNAAALASAAPTFPKAVSFPTRPIVCMRRRVTSIGYVTVCATRPENAPHCIRSTVVKSRRVKCWIFVCHCQRRRAKCMAGSNVPLAFLVRSM